MLLHLFHIFILMAIILRKPFTMLLTFYQLRQNYLQLDAE